MKGKIVGIIAIIIVITLVAIGFSYFSTGEPYWETETEFGMWQDELIIEFADGTTESLKMIQEGNKPFTIYYEGKVITSATMKVTAKVSGSGYTGAEIKTTGFGYTGKVMEGMPGPGTVLHSQPLGRTDGTMQINMDSTRTVHHCGVSISYTIDKNPSKFPSGIYTLYYIPYGTVQYRGVSAEYDTIEDDPDWKTATLPPTRYLILSVQRAPTGSILVTLSSETTTA